MNHRTKILSIVLCLLAKQEQPECCLSMRSTLCDRIKHLFSRSQNQITPASASFTPANERLALMALPRYEGYRAGWPATPISEDYGSTNAHPILEAENYSSDLITINPISKTAKGIVQSRRLATLIRDIQTYNPTTRIDTSRLRLLLNAAIERGDEYQVGSLLSQNMKLIHNINTKDMNGNTPMELALSSNIIPIIRLLHIYGAPHPNPLDLGVAPPPPVSRHIQMAGNNES